jgi:hypothetical protein
VSIDEQHIALPKLYGAPAYARPAPVVATSPRPFDPDDLPIEAFMTEDERDFASELPAYAWAPGGATNGTSGHDAHDDGEQRRSHRLKPRPLHLRRIAGRLLGDD